MIRTVVRKEWKDLFRSNDDCLMRERIHEYVINKLILTPQDKYLETIDSLEKFPPGFISNKRLRVQYAEEISRWTAMDRRFMVEMVRIVGSMEREIN